MSEFTWQTQKDKRVRDAHKDEPGPGFIDYGNNSRPVDVGPIYAYTKDGCYLGELIEGHGLSQDFTQLVVRHSERGEITYHPRRYSVVEAKHLNGKTGVVVFIDTENDTGSGHPNQNGYIADSAMPEDANIQTPGEVIWFPKGNTAMPLPVDATAIPPLILTSGKPVDNQDWERFVAANQIRA